MVNSRVPFTFTESELRTLLEDPHSCVSLKKCKRHIAVSPSSLGDIPRAIRESLNSLVTIFDTELDGIVLGYRKMKLLSGDGGILNDAAHIHLDVKAQFFVFKPEVGSTLTGIIKKKSPDHIGCLLHKVFNVSIPHPNVVKEERPIEIGQQVTFKVDEVDLSNTLPYIKGTLISVGENQTLSGSADSMEELFNRSKKGSVIERYLLLKKKENASVNHEREEDGMEDITAAEDLIDPTLPYTFPTSILKKRDSSESMSPSKRITFSNLKSSYSMSEESDDKNKKTKMKKFTLPSSSTGALNMNKEKDELSSPEKHRKKKRKKEDNEAYEDDEEADKVNKKKDKRVSDREQENTINLGMIRNVKKENEDDNEKATPSKKKKQHLRNLEDSFLGVTQHEVETRREENEQPSLSDVRKHSKKKRKRDEYEGNETVGGQGNVSGAENSFEDVTGIVKKKKKKKESSEQLRSPQANSSVLPGHLSPSDALKRLKCDLGILSPIVRAEDASSGEENGLTSSTQIEEISRKRSKVQKSPSPQKVLGRHIKEEHTTLKVVTPATSRRKAKAEVQGAKSPKEVLRGQVQKRSSSDSDSDTSSSEPPDEPSFQGFKEKLEKEKRIASSDSSSSEPSDLSSMKQIKENAMKKIFKTTGQRSVSHLLKRAGSDSSSSEDEVVTRTSLSGKIVSRTSKKKDSKSSQSKFVGESKGKERRKTPDSKVKKDKKKENTLELSSLVNSISEKETKRTNSAKKTSKKVSKTEGSSKQKKKSKTKDNSTVKMSSPGSVDPASLAALAETLLTNFKGK